MVKTLKLLGNGGMTFQNMVSGWGGAYPSSSKTLADPVV